MTKSLPRFSDESSPMAETVCDSESLVGSQHVTIGEYGPGMMVSDGEPHPSALEWRIESSGGQREIWALYASSDQRPVDVYVNDRLVIERALSDITGGWHEPDLMWWFQQLVELAPGENRLRLVGHGPLPHIHRVMVCHLSREEMVDVGARRAAEGRRESSASFKHFPPEGSNQLLRPLHDFYLSARKQGMSDFAIASAAHNYLRVFGEYGQRPEAFDGFGVFNGQKLRSRIVNDLIESVEVSGIVETGSYLGRTTEHLARSGLPVLSCEIIPHIFMKASFRLNGYDNVSLFNCDSRSLLTNTLTRYPEVYRRPLFYLDAHWYDDLPLPEEINFVTSHVVEYVIVIDDFEVQGSEYGFDRYDNGNELTFNFLLPRMDLTSNPVFLVPNRPASEETGLRRGTLVVVSEVVYERCLKGMALLKRVHPENRAAG